MNTQAKFGYPVDIVPPDALKGELKVYLPQAKPTFFLAVPRVWEKFKEGLQKQEKEATGVKKTIISTRKWFLADSKIAAENWKKGRIFDGIRLVFDRFIVNQINKKVLEAVGLQRCKVTASGAGAIDPSVVDFFKDYNIRILDLYGLSETSGPTALSTVETPVGSAGKPLTGINLKIIDPETDNEVKDGEGEIRIKGRHVFKGYWNNPEETKKAFDKNGFFRTGDLGKLDAKGNLFITGRIKELIKTSGGENVPFLRIEQNIKDELPIVDQAVLIGDKRHFLTCLLTLHTVADAKGNPTNNLTPAVIEQFVQLGSAATTLQEAQADAKVKAFLEEGVARANKKADSKAQSVQKVAVLPECLSVANEMMTATQKLKRKAIEKRFAAVISQLYA